MHPINPQSAIRNPQSPGGRRTWAAILVGAGLLVSAGAPRAAEGPALEAPRDVQVFDLPNDGGGGLGVRWAAAPSDSAQLRYQVFLAEAPEFPGEPDGPFAKVAEIAANTRYDADVRAPWWTWRKTRGTHFVPLRSGSGVTLRDGRTYYVKVALTDGRAAAESAAVAGVPRPNAFNWGKLNNAVLLALFAATILLSIRHARRTPNLFLRRIPGLDAVEEAIGRATEMGRPILYLTGSDDMSSLSTIAATVILSEVAKRVATYDTQLTVPHRDPIVMAVCQEVVKEAYLAAGRPDAYREDSNFFITTDQFSYTAAVDGIMLRDRPAANFFMGFYYAEALLLAETGASTGAIQIAGTDADAQLPFFITACDYTLIGEELYAASAYLSRERVLVGTLRGQDLGKAFLLAVLVAGALLATLDQALGLRTFSGVLELFRDFR